MDAKVKEVELDHAEMAFIDVSMRVTQRPTKMALPKTGV